MVQMFLFAIESMMLPGWNLRDGLVSTFKSIPPKPAGEILALTEQTHPLTMTIWQNSTKTQDILSML